MLEMKNGKFGWGNGPEEIRITEKHVDYTGETQEEIALEYFSKAYKMF